MYHLGHVFLSCDIPTVTLQYIIRAEYYPLNAQTYCRNYVTYMFQLQSSRQQAGYVRSTKGNHIPVVYI
jgi:hypothetical protein